MSVKENDCNGLYTKDGTDIWRCMSYCTVPSVRMKNLDTGEMQDFGLGGLIDQEFKKIEMSPEKDSK